MYSALAGFVEPGETIEDAARREVFEESGVRVGAGARRDEPALAIPVQPDDRARRRGRFSAEITLDENELEDARWFSPEEARLMVARTHPDGLYAANPYAIAHELVRVALEN